ncbi:MAG: trans-2-enoyl-CoA reductase family protein [Phycisphaerae bacterium]|nr:trans-2-enoyl-CoA reductase family protein [Phycisphaerae bacterium]
MIIEPVIRDNVCLTAHPLGCEAQVLEQINYIKSQGPMTGPKRVLIIGASNGYGLAARIVSAFACRADTLGVAFERPGRAKRTASAGWYNTEAFTRQARASGLGVWNINADAFSNEAKEEVLETIRTHLGQIDWFLYSIAAPRRKDPVTGDLFSSVIKPIGEPSTSKTVNFLTGEVTEVTAQPASPTEVEQTVKVMGGEDWSLWIQYLMDAGVLAQGARTMALSYIGPECTRAVYRDGTIGRAKAHLEQTVGELTQRLEPIKGQAWISVNKALVTRASAVIPAVPLYISLLYRVMKAKGLHENCIQQMNRLYRDFLFGTSVPPPKTDDQGRIRLDDWEMREDVQEAVRDLWDRINDGNARQLADIEGFKQEFLRHHGFDMPGIDYMQDLGEDIVASNAL